MHDATPTPHLLRRRAVWVVAGVCALLGTGGGIAWRTLHAPHSPFPAEVAQKVSFPLYYPTKLPDGFSLTKNSINGTPQVVLYSVSAPGGATISVSVQARADDVDMAAFYKSQLSGAYAVPTKNGVAKIGKLKSGGTFASLVTNGSWVIGTSPDDTLQQPIQQLFTSLRADR
jgi:hypothetical protein